MTNFNEKLLAANRLLNNETTSREKFEHIRTLIKGLNPKLDKTLENCSKALSKIEDLKEGDILELSAENLAENTEKEKRRKKALLFFIKNYRDLQNEVKRAQSELGESKGKSGSENVQSIAKLLTSFKGAFGLITVVAIIVASILLLAKSKPADKVSNVPNQQAPSKIQVIDVDGKRVPLGELRTGIGLECKTSGSEVEHYHAKNGVSAQATDGTEVTDPGGCGFGKVNEVQIEEI